MKEGAYHLIIFLNLVLANHNDGKLGFFLQPRKMGMQILMTSHFPLKSHGLPGNVFRLKRRNIFPSVPVQPTFKAFASNYQLLFIIYFPETN